MIMTVAFVTVIWLHPFFAVINSSTRFQSTVSGLLLWSCKPVFLHTVKENPWILQFTEPTQTHLSRLSAVFTQSSIHSIAFDVNKIVNLTLKHDEQRKEVNITGKHVWYKRLNTTDSVLITKTTTQTAAIMTKRMYR